MNNIKVTVKNAKVKQVEESPKKVAVQFDYYPAIRVCVPVNGNEDIYDVNVKEHARKLVLEKLRTWTKEEILDWVLENEADYGESYEPYDEEYDEI
jgi:hypothetical protein